VKTEKKLQYPQTPNSWASGLKAIFTKNTPG